MILQNGWPWLTLTEKVYIGDNSLTKMTEEHSLKKEGKLGVHFSDSSIINLCFGIPKIFSLLNTPLGLLKEGQKALPPTN